MKKFVIFLFALMLGVGAISTGPNAWATSYDPTGAAGTWPVMPSTPMIWNHGAIGDALFGEMYRAVIGEIADPFNFATYVSIENVSPYWVAAHVRLRSGRYSIEVWDRPILLSPRDVFWFQFQVSEGVEHLNVTISSSDTGTLQHSGLITAAETSYTASLDPDILRQFTTLYPDPYDPILYEELTQGHIEVIGLWALPNTVPGASATFPMATATFPVVMNALNTDTGVPACRNADGTEDVNNVGFSYVADAEWAKACAMDVGKFLMGHVFMGDFTNGLYFGYPMRAIKDFRARFAGAKYRDCYIRNGSVGGAVAGTVCENRSGQAYNPALILYAYENTAQTDAAYSEPDWATSFGPTLNDGTDYFADGDSYVDSFSLDDFEDAIVKQVMAADFFNGGFSGETFTLAAVTFPTKYLHYFFDCYSGMEDKKGYCYDIPELRGYCPWDATHGDCWPVGLAEKASLVRASLDVANFTGSVGLSTGIWNLEEKPAGGGSPYRRISLPWEVNFIPIGDLSLEKLTPFCFLTADSPFTPYAVATYPTWNAGWFLMDTFQLVSDYRWYDNCYAGYCYEDFTLLGYVGPTLPPSGQIMDWEFTNFSHGRSYEPSWDNPTFVRGDIGTVANPGPVKVPCAYPWYTGSQNTGPCTPPPCE